MQRYAVLHDLSSPDTPPVGVLIERANRVQLVAVDECRVRGSYDGEYTTIEPDGSLVTYRPGMSEYWDYVLLMLSRTFLIGEVDTRARIDTADALQLYFDKVLTHSVVKARPYASLTAALTMSIAATFSQTYAARAVEGPARDDRVDDRLDDDNGRRHGDRRHDQHGSFRIPAAA